jgi:hypothetical protein
MKSEGLAVLISSAYGKSRIEYLLRFIKALKVICKVPLQYSRTNFYGASKNQTILTKVSNSNRKLGNYS